MKRTFAVMVLATFMMMAFAPMAFAAEGSADSGMSFYFGMVVLGSGLAIGLAALGTGIGMGLGIGRACEGVARNPGVSNKIMTTLIVGLALVESLAIYAFVVGMIMMFMYKPFGG